MKLVKVKISRDYAECIYYIDGIDEFSEIFKNYKRTYYQKSVQECLNIIINENTNLCSINETIGHQNSEYIYEIEFEKLEDLIELIPEEFL